MARYLFRGSYSSGTTATMVKNPQNRRDALRPVVEAMGGKLEAFYFAFGEDDVYVTVDMPDNVSAAALSMAVAASGSLRNLSTTVLMTAEEAMEAMRKAGGIAYKPPA